MGKEKEEWKKKKKKRWGLYSPPISEISKESSMLQIVNKTTRCSCQDFTYSHGNKITIMMVRWAAAPAFQIRANFQILWASPSSNFTSTFLFYKYLFLNAFKWGRIISFPPFLPSSPSQIPSPCHLSHW